MDPAQQSFREFMLAGKGAQSTAPMSTPPKSRSLLSQSQDDSPSNAKGSQKSVRNIVKTFQSRVADWKEVDSQLEAVLRSIVNLRDRIWWESSAMRRLTNEAAPKPWQNSGYRKQRSFLTKDDVDLALSHDLLQHEKMLASCRSLIASLAQVQEALGRRLDEWMQVHMEESIVQAQSSWLDDGQEMYQWCAGELLRKQELVQQLIDSTSNGLVDNGTSNNINDPRSVARECFNGWLSSDKEMVLKIKQFEENQLKKH